VVLKAIDSWTGHGIPNIFSAETLFAKVAWSVVLVLFFIPCCYYIYNSIAGFFEYDVISNIKILKQAELTFPAVVFCGWYSDESIADSIVSCTFNNEDCQSNQIEFEPIIVTGYGLSFKHNCIRINGQNVLDKSNNRLVSVKQESIFDAGLSITFLMPENVGLFLLILIFFYTNIIYISYYFTNRLIYISVFLKIQCQYIPNNCLYI
jgi:hypothetical protein